MRVAIVIPAFNEASRIAGVIRGARPYGEWVVVVDDGSTDGTGGIARGEGAAVVCHLENSGAGAATMTGIEAARSLGADTVVTLDADGQHDPSDIPKLLGPVIENRADIVFANRFGPASGKPRNNIPTIRRAFNALGNVVTWVATRRWVRDSQCGFKVFGPRALREVQIRMSGFEFCTEIVRESVQRGWRIVEVPTKVVYSEYTMAKGQSFANGIRTALKILLRSFLR